MKAVEIRNQRRERRKRGLRSRLFGTTARPRLTVFRSSKHIYAQVIDDLRGHTLASASTNEKGGDDGNGGNCSAAGTVGERLASRAKEAGVEAVIFDRNGYRYHGRVKALADGARKGGLQF